MLVLPDRLYNYFLLACVQLKDPSALIDTIVKPHLYHAALPLLIEDKKNKEKRHLVYTASRSTADAVDKIGIKN